MWLNVQQENLFMCAVAYRKIGLALWQEIETSFIILKVENFVKRRGSTPQQIPCKS